MRIDKVHIINFRNFSDALVNFSPSTLIIGANDIGKTNLIYSLRLLLDKSLSERDIQPSETDFHIKQDGVQTDNFSITIHFCDVKEDAVLSILKGNISDDSETVFKLTATRADLDYKFYVGPSDAELEGVNSRFYLKYINLRYVHSQRDLHKFIDSEKKQLLKISQLDRTETEKSDDSIQLNEIGQSLNIVNEKVSELNYVQNSTDLVNEELQKLAYTFSGYEVHLDSGAIQVEQFINNLQLNA